MINNILYWNPWWTEKFSPNIEHRDVFEHLSQILKRKEIVFISGVRRAGKTSAMYYIITNLLDNKIPKENILYLNLDDEILRHHTLEDIYKNYKEIFPNSKGEKYILLDEIQNIDNWERWAKNKYDSFEEIKLIVTGSKSHILKTSSSALLTGRMLEMEVYPLSFKEFLNFKSIKHSTLISKIKNELHIKQAFNEYLEFGGFPEITLEKEKRMKFFLLQQYFENIRDKDIIRYFNIKDTKKFEKMIFFVISNITKPFSANKMGTLVNLSTNSVISYLNYSELVYMFLPLKAFNFSLKHQMLLPQKYYSVDTGFINAISFKFSENLGRILENTVFIELKRENLEIYYHRDKKECDFVIKHNMKISQAIQVTKTLENHETKNREIAGLMDAMNKYNLKSGLILTYDEESTEEHNGKTVIIKPIWKWLLERNT